MNQDFFLLLFPCKSCFQVDVYRGVYFETFNGSNEQKIPRKLLKDLQWVREFFFQKSIIDYNRYFQEHWSQIHYSLLNTNQIHIIDHFLKTFLHYFQTKSKKSLNVGRFLFYLGELQDMTFVDTNAGKLKTTFINILMYLKH